MLCLSLSPSVLPSGCVASGVAVRVVREFKWQENKALTCFILEGSKRVSATQFVAICTTELVGMVLLRMNHAIAKGMVVVPFDHKRQSS